MNKLVLIDGNAIMHRAYHALPPLTTKSGEPINAVYGFVSMLLGIINEMRPSHLAVCFDRPEKTFRRKKFVKYQAQRPKMDEFLVTQIVKAHDVVSAFGIPVYEKAGYEADDLLGTIAKQSQTNKSTINETVIITGDRDIFQLISKKVKVYVPVKGLKEGKLYGIHEVKHEFDFEPIQMIDYKALVGDSSDNYPGVSGIGPKTARELIVKYKTVEEVFKNLDNLPEKTKNKLIGSEEDALFFKNIATIVTDVPVKVNFKKMKDWDLGSEEAIKLFMSYGFKTLLGRITNTAEKSALPPIETKKNLSKSDIESVVLMLVKKLEDRQYAIRGTAGMVLQGLDMGVDDIDVVADKKTALLFNDLFKKEVLKRVEYLESDKFKSYYGKFVINGISLEVMGEWQIKKGEDWSGVYDASDDEVNIIDVNGLKVKVEKLEIELKTSAEMGRWSEFHKIKKQLSKTQQRSLF